ncbi:7968_t:CDS:1, partial [Cetraspora pellucida]
KLALFELFKKKTMKNNMYKTSIDLEIYDDSMDEASFDLEEKINNSIEDASFDLDFCNDFSQKLHDKFLAYNWHLLKKLQKKITKSVEETEDELSENNSEFFESDNKV